MNAGAFVHKVYKLIAEFAVFFLCVTYLEFMVAQVGVSCWHLY